MKTIVYKLSLCIFIFGMITLSCEGPAGPAGETGQQGPQGEPGSQGPQGEEGTANVIYSEWFTFIADSGSDEFFQFMRLSEPQLTREFLNNGGVVLVYVKVEQEEIIVVASLPLHSGVFLADYRAFDAEAGVIGPQAFRGIQIHVETTDDTITIPDNFFEGHHLRYILIPGGMPAKLSQDFWENYEAVADYFGIRD